MTAREDRSVSPRWLVSAAIVLLAHGGVAVAMMHWHEASDEAAPAAAIVIDLAPAMMAPDQPLQDQPPGAEQMQSEAVQEQKIDKAEEKFEEKPASRPEPQQELAPAVNPEVALAAEPPGTEAAPEPTPSEVAAPTTSAPQVPRFESSAVTTAPALAQPSAADLNAVPNWTRKVVALLERNKRYPAAARARRERGAAQLAFSIDRKGRLVASRIVKSSGSTALDNAALELVRRAQPFPPPPAAMPGEQIDLAVPVQFNAR